MKYTPEIVADIVFLKESGEFSDKDICRKVGISQETFITWKNDKPEFSEAIKKAEKTRLEAFKNMARSGLAKLLDVYEYEEVTTEYTDNGKGQPKVKGRKVVKKFVMPNPVAIIFTLTNQDSENFKRNPESEAIAGEVVKQLIINTASTNGSK